jgi:hypothetical protein
MAINDDFRTKEEREEDNRIWKEKRNKYLAECISISTTNQHGEPVILTINRAEAQKLVSFSGLLDDLKKFKSNYELWNTRF